jgi:hypothetical protein
MDTLKLSELVGKEIKELRFHYVPENEHALQSFHAYIKISDDSIIDIPDFDNDDYLTLSQDNLDYFRMRFDSGQAVSNDVQKYFVGQIITDFYFSYYNDEVDFDRSAFIKLSNGYYLTENNFGPVGLAHIDLIILDEENFQQEVKNLNDIGVDVRSFTRTKNAC